VAWSLPEFRLATQLAEHEFAARHHLGASDAQALTVDELLALAGDDAPDLGAIRLSYGEQRGSDELRAVVAATYHELEADDVLTFSGGSEALFWALLELAGEDGHAVVTVPNYQPDEAVLLAAGVRVSPWPMDPARGWALDLDVLEALLRDDTRLVCVTVPHNPTGAVPDPGTMVALTELCDARGVRLLSDEVFRGIELDSARTAPQAADLAPTAVSIGALAKAYGLPGLRIGWLAARDRRLLERIERRKQYTSICNSPVTEVLGTIALAHREAVLRRNRGIVEDNLPRFAATFATRAAAFAWEAPQGGCVSYPRYLGAEGVEAFCRALVHEAGVLVIPASVFASELAPAPDDRFRVGLGRTGSAPALAAVEAFVDA